MSNPNERNDAEIGPAIMAAVRLLERRVYQPVSVDDAAAEAGLSKFHFQRLFKQQVGEPVAAHLRRLRLERAALALRNSETPILEIALEHQFRSHAGFTHAFTKLFGMSPTEFRGQTEVRPFMRLPQEGWPKTDRDALLTCPLTVLLVDEPPQLLAVHRYQGPASGIPQHWEVVLRWAHRVGLSATECDFLGLHYDHWCVTAEENYRYDAALALSTARQPDGVPLIEMPAGLTAKVSFTGPVAEMDAAWDLLVNRWLPASGYQFRLDYVYDRYPRELFVGGLAPEIALGRADISATLCLPISKVWRHSADE